MFVQPVWQMQFPFPLIPELHNPLLQFGQIPVDERNQRFSSVFSFFLSFAKQRKTNHCKMIHIAQKHKSHKFPRLLPNSIQDCSCTIHFHSILNYKFHSNKKGKLREEKSVFSLLFLLFFSFTLFCQTLASRTKEVGCTLITFASGPANKTTTDFPRGARGS